MSWGAASYGSVAWGGEVGGGAFVPGPLEPPTVGIRHQLYLGGFEIALPPESIGETPFRAETAERTVNAFTFVDRPWLFAGAPDSIQKFSWALEWPSVNSADYQVFAEIESVRGSFDFTLWRPIVETFSGDGTSKTFRLMRRLAQVALAASAPPEIDWTPVTKISGVQVQNPAFGAADSIGSTLFTFASPPAATPSNVRILYTPVYYVRVVRQTREMARSFAEGRVLLLEEM